MDILADADLLGEDGWRIYTRHRPSEPQFIGEGAVIEKSSITEGCEIWGNVYHSVLGSGVKVMKGATVRNSVIFSDVTIEENVTLEYAIVDSGALLASGSRVLGDPLNIKVVESGYVLDKNEKYEEKLEGGRI